jgi:glycosyltransferase involved in cell wall biosynthesis
MFRKGKNCSKQCLHCRIFSHLKKILSNLPDSVVGISNNVLNRHLKDGYFNKIPYKQVIYNPYDRFTISDKRPDDKIIHFGFLGRVTIAKGIERLLEALRRVNNDNYILHVGGKGDPSYIDYLKERFPINAIYHGFVDKSKLLNMIDFLIVPSLWNEPSGRIIIEAYSHGVPVVGSKSGGIPEIIENGKTGFIFNHERKNDLVDTLRICFQQREKLKKMENICVEKSKQFSPEICADSYLKAYNQII